MSLAAIIFDMDGLMVDTEPLSRLAWEQVLAPFGITLADDVYGRMIGHRTGDAVRMLLDSCDLPLTAAEIMKRKAAVLAEILAGGVPVMPGLMVLQAEIARRRLPWAVATSSPRRQAKMILDQLELLDSCQAIAAGDEVIYGKPAPDIYRLAAERLGVSPAQCLALEDSAPGCRSAAAAGMVTVVIPNGKTKTADFPCAAHILPSLTHVLANLDSLLSIET